MKMTPEELELAKSAAAKLLRHRSPELSKEDADLLKKYPKHTLEEARYIDSCECGETSVGKGHEDSFWKIRMQETHNLRPGYDT